MFFTPIGIIFPTFIFIVCSCNTPKLKPVRVTTELNIGESQVIKLSDGDIVKLSLLEINEVRDSLRNAIRAAYVKVSVDSDTITLISGNYNLPVVIGKTQIDCPVTKGYYSNTRDDSWKLKKDARFRLWPKGSPYIQPGTFIYPIKQNWFASMTQSGNEPTYVDWGEDPAKKGIYYHSGHDIGGAEGMDEIVSATDGLVISSRNQILGGYDSSSVYIHPDAVSVIDERGWILEYDHLDSTDPAIKPGVRVKMGQKIGFIGKQGDSGGWVHLHFEIRNKETPTSDWRIEDAYPYVWESFVQQYNPPLIAVARPHQLVWTGQEVTLDGRKSKSFDGGIVSYEWTFTDGTTALGAVQKRIYEKPGEYSEILKVTDSKGNVDYDFTVVQVYDCQSLAKHIPTIHAAYYPTLNIKPGDSVTFIVRTFNSDVGNEEWDFGDNSPRIKVKSVVNHNDPTQGKFAETVHSFAKPGHYIVKVERSNENGFKAIAHLHVEVNNYSTSFFTSGQNNLNWINGLPYITELPDPFLMNNGSRVSNLSDWLKHRDELKEKFQFYEYGHFMPPFPVSEMSVSPDSIIEYGKDSIKKRVVQLKTGPEGKISFTLNLFIPGKGKGPFPVIIDGDLCWGSLLTNLTEEGLLSLVKRGYIIAEFDRTKFAPDQDIRNNKGFPPNQNFDSGAIVEWAWGYQRTVDYLLTLKIIDKTKIGVTGWSRGGKAALLAGAFDERITLVAPNCSGTCGSGPLRFIDTDGETIDDIATKFPYWFCSNFQNFLGRNKDKLPVDQHSLIALVAPRAYLCTNGLKDAWANPRGTAQAHLAAREVFVALGAQDKMGIFYINTGHDHNIDKWNALLDFADKVFYRKTPSYDYKSIPFPDLKKAYSWSAPKQLF